MSCFPVVSVVSARTALPVLLCCRYIKIISKVENQEGIQNFDEILEKTGEGLGFMVILLGLGFRVSVGGLRQPAQAQVVKRCVSVSVRCSCTL